MKKLHINLSDHSYDIIIKDNLIDDLSEYVKEVYSNKKIYVITDSNVAPLYLTRVMKALENDYEVKSVVLPAGEESKSFAVYQEACEKLIDLNIRQDL